MTATIVPQSVAVTLKTGVPGVTVTAGDEAALTFTVGTGGPRGLDGEQGDPGDDGREVELQVSATHVQWRYVGDVSWVNLVALASLKGDPGDPGAPGAPGADGDDGREAEFQASATHIQWRLVGDATWLDLTALSALKGDPGDPGAPGTDGDPGADGRAVELQKTATHIQWRLVGDVSWVNLVALVDITGAPGEDGAPGSPGADGADGVDGSVWFNGAGAPGAGLGVDGDRYLNDTNGDVHLKAAGAWSITGNIKGTDGSPGAPGGDGADGVGVPVGGTAGQVLAKASATDFDTEWVDAASGGGTPEVYVQQTRPSATGPWMWWETDASGAFLDLVVNDGVP